MVHAEHESGMRLGEAIRRVAKKSGKTEQALKSAFYRRYPASEHNRNRIFSEEEEEVATLMIRSVSYLHLDWTRKQAREILEIAFEKAISESSLNRFCERHSDLFTSRTPTSLGAKRIDEGIYESSLQYAQQLGHFLESKQFPRHAVVNYDETRIVIGSNNKMMVRRLVSRHKTKPQSRAVITKSHCATFLPFLAADGELIACYFVLSAKFSDEGIATPTIELARGKTRHLRGNVYYKIMYTHTGYVNNAAFQQICEDFFIRWQIVHPGLDCLCLGDNLEPHRQPILLRKGLESGIYMWFFPPNTSHWSQPFDNLLYARLKQNIAREKQDLEYLSIFTTENLFSLVSVTLHAAIASFSVKTTASAFQNTGVFPFDPKLIERLARENHLPAEKDDVTITPKEEMLVSRVVTEVEQSWRRCSMEAQKRSGKVEKVRVTVKKGKLFDPVDVIAADRQKKENEVKEAEEREKAKKMKQENREKKKKEEEEALRVKKIETQRRKHESAKKITQLEKARQAKECKGGCGARWRTTGPGWTGCEYCDIFWMCPICAEEKTHQRSLAVHERMCQKQKK